MPFPPITIKHCFYGACYIWQYLINGFNLIQFECLTRKLANCSNFVRHTGISHTHILNASVQAKVTNPVRGQEQEMGPSPTMSNNINYQRGHFRQLIPHSKSICFCHPVSETNPILILFALQSPGSRLHASDQ